MRNKSMRLYFIAVVLVVVCLIIYNTEVHVPSLKMEQLAASQGPVDVSVFVKSVGNGRVVKNNTECRDGKIFIFLEIQQVTDKTDPFLNKSDTKLNRTQVITKNTPRETTKTTDSNTSLSGSVQAVPLTTGANPYKINNKEICRGIKDILFIVLFHTATEHFERRQFFRQTWANVSLYQKIQMRVAFLLGLPKNGKVQSKLEEENKIYRDLVQGNFLDTYHNLTHKGVLGLRWITENCRQARFIVKVDDDVFVNTLLLIENILIKNVNASRQIMGHVSKKDAEPIRRKGKWKVDEHKFRNVTKYPFPGCKGYFVVLTRDIIEKLYETAKVTPFFWIDDIYLFGLLPFKVGNITHVPLEGLSIKDKKTIECFNSTQKRCPLLAGVAHTDGIVTRMWWRNIVSQYQEQALTYLKSSSSLLKKKH